MYFCSGPPMQNLSGFEDEGYFMALVRMFDQELVVTMALAALLSVSRCSHGSMRSARWLTQPAGA
jgi:hypothetical protein